MTMKNLNKMLKQELEEEAKAAGLSYNKNKLELIKDLRAYRNTTKANNVEVEPKKEETSRVDELESKMDKMFNMLSQLTQPPQVIKPEEQAIPKEIPIVQDTKLDDSEVEELIDESDDSPVIKGEASEGMVLSEYLNIRSITLDELEMLVQNYKITNPGVRDRVSTIEEIESKIKVGEEKAKEIIASGQTQALIVDLHISDALQKTYGWVVKDIKMNGEHYLIAA